MIKLLNACLAFLVLLSFINCNSPEPVKTVDTNNKWWKEAIVYQIYSDYMNFKSIPVGEYLEHT